MATAVTAKAHKHIRRYLDTARTKWVMLRFLEGSLKVLAVTGIVVLLSFLADNALTLSPWLRGSLLGVCIVVFLGGLGREMFLLTYRVPSDESMARIIEKKHPDLDNRVINSVMLSKKELSGGAAMIVSSLVNSTAATVDRFDLRGIVNVKRLRQFAVAAVLVLVLLVGYGFAMPQHFGNAFKRFIMPFKYVPPITDTRIAVEPGDITVGYGRPVDIIARVSGEMPSVVTVYFRVKGKGDFISKEMEFNGQDFIHSFTSVTDDIQYYVIAGDAKSPRFLLTRSVVPSVARLDIEFTFPDFTFLGTKVLKEASGAITALKDTRVKLIGTSNVTLGNASIVLNDEKTLTVPTEGKNFTAEFTVETDGFYIIRLQDVEGVRNENPSRHPITLIADKNPEVRIIRPHAEVTTSPEREVIISFQAADNFGLKWIEVAYRLNAGEEQIADHWELKPGTKISVDQARLGTWVTSRPATTSHGSCA
ncbi:MAG: DUF4175 family protein [Planctomycetota bacterium]|nr:DUF4175 family protein [Planctomycetota bacterium]